jgi:hypothetical protein
MRSRISPGAGRRYEVVDAVSWLAVPPATARLLEFIMPRLASCFCLAFAALVGSSVVAAEKHPSPFDGTLDGWVTADGKPVTKGWEAVDGVLHLTKGKDKGGNIFTADELGDFTLSFDWKIAPKGNSGLKYRVRTYDKKTLGIEYQIYDDIGAKIAPDAKGATASIYDIYGPASNKKLNPPGDWNSAKIVVRNNRIEHWLNGERVATAVIGSADWNAHIAQSKFKDVPNFSKNPRGKLMLTDHGSEVWYKNFVYEPHTSMIASSSGYRRVGPLRRVLRSIGR